mgnify:CR=1 FL=1
MKALKIIASLFLVTSLSYAYTLKQSVNKVLEENPEIVAEKQNQEAFRKYIDEREGALYPRVDLDGRIEKSNSEKDYYEDNPSGLEDGSDQEDGYNFGISINQMLYDGRLTPSRIDEAKYNNLANRYRTNLNIEDIVLKNITAYMGLVRYKELIFLSEDMIKVNEKNLQIAKEQEIISGQSLETYQVSSKLNFAKEKFLEEKDFEETRVNTFKRFLGTKPQGDECRPQIDETVFPNNLKKLTKEAVLNNYEILEQIQWVKAQREKIAQADASFLPNLNLELRATTDKDLALNEEGYEDQAIIRINMDWNLYNGGADDAVSKQEELFLAEQKKRLDAITNKIIESVEVTYQRFQKNKERIDVLKDYIIANENIVSIYKSEFEAGTRTFVDILNAQTDLYEARQSLINREFDLYSNYYELLNSLSILSKTVQNSDDSQCIVKKVKLLSEEKVDETEDLNVSEELSALLDSDSQEDSQDVESLLNDNSLNDETKLGNISKMLEASSDKYILNLGTTKGLDAAKAFVNEYNLNKQEAFTYSYGVNEKSAKVVYGIFDNITEAKSAMKNLPNEILKNKPYVDNISKHQNLYKKYHK